jgi:diphthine methyl ester acylhydrolase
MAEVTELDSVNLEFPPCCIEFWPADSSYFVIGTYLLQQDNDRDDLDSMRGQADDERDELEGSKDGSARRQQNRDGSLVLMKLDKGKM